MLEIAGKSFHSRLFLGTGKFSSYALMGKAVAVSGTEMVTLALKRVNVGKEDDIMMHLQQENVHLLPNTSGACDAREAVLAAHLAREALGTNWVKLEVHPDPNYLMPDPLETLKAAEQLVKDGFVVLPYCHADPVLCKHLEEVGTQAVMPLAAPIGSNLGLAMKEMLAIIIEQSNVPVVIDAGIGAPSHASMAMEMGADAVLVNTAVAVSDDPLMMAEAFKLAVLSGRLAHDASLPEAGPNASPSSPLTEFIKKS